MDSAKKLFVILKEIIRVFLLLLKSVSYYLITRSYNSYKSVFVLIKLTVYIKLSIHVVIDDKSISNSCIPSLLVVIKEFSTIYPLISTKVQIP
jgi:hypothetical protein